MISSAAPEIEPVLLKGVALWSTCYPDPICRQVRDLDIMVEEPQKLIAFCDILESLGYQSLEFVGDCKTYREHILNSDTYSIPPFRICRKVGLSSDEASHLREFPSLAASVHFEEISGEFTLTLDIEPHKTVFVLSDGKHACYDRSYYQSAKVCGAFREMTLATNLVYIATKFVFDAVDALAERSRDLKCLKLAVDFNRLLVSATQKEIEAAIQLARNWGTLHNLINMIAMAAPLLPERKFEARLLENRQNLLMDLLHVAFSNRLGIEDLSPPACTSDFSLA
jgi:hypothetical protein